MREVLRIRRYVTTIWTVYLGFGGTVVIRGHFRTGRAGELWVARMKKLLVTAAVLVASTAAQASIIPALTKPAAIDPNYETSGRPFSVTPLNGVSAEPIYATLSNFEAFSAVADKNTGMTAGIPGFNTGDQGVLTALVPEPAGWGLMLLGAGLTGGALRNRRRLAAA
ncbi:MAG: hypothetical protein JWO83_3129 [Caulobacteraceae bacterium]|nr:hypothetical protein [Caulobacteraceae bacterium]